MAEQAIVHPRRAVRLRLPLIVVVAVLLLLPALVQGQPKPNLPRGNHLTLALRCPFSLSQAALEDYFNTARANNKSTDQGGVPPGEVFKWSKADIKSTDQATYYAIVKFLDPDFNWIEDLTTGEPKISLQPKMWEIDLGNPLHKLNSISITFEGEKEPVKYELGKTIDGVQLVGTKRGIYYLSGLLKKTPKKYLLSVTDYKTGNTVPSSTKDWPQPKERYWLVTLRDWEGDEKALFKVFSDNDVFENVVSGFSDTQVSRMGIGSFIDQENPVEGLVGLNKFSFRVGLPKSTNPAYKPTAWILFPLTRSEAEKAGKMIPDGFLKPPQYVTEQNPVLAGKELILEPGKPQWFEAPFKAAGLFERTATIKEIAKWQDLAAKKPNEKFYKLVVWEVTKGGVRQAGKFTGGKYYFIQEVPAWPTAIQKAKEPGDTPSP